jgi:hypothetical protein
MKRDIPEICIKLCLLSSCFFVFCGVLRSGFSCDNQCREIQYFYACEGPKSFIGEYQTKSCRPCVLAAGCSTNTTLIGGTCTKQDTDMMWRVASGSPMCNCPEGSTTLEAAGNPGVSKFTNLFEKIYLCK